MTEAELKNLLFKLSVEAIYSISNGSTDSIGIKEAIEHYAYSRPTINSVQMIKVMNSSNGWKTLKFLLSPYCLINNHSLNIQHGLDELEWYYTLPDYDYGKEEESESEEGVVNWLTRGTIDLSNASPNTYKMTLEKLYDAVLSKKD